MQLRTLWQMTHWLGSVIFCSMFSTSCCSLEVSDARIPASARLASEGGVSGLLVSGFSALLEDSTGAVPCSSFIIGILGKPKYGSGYPLGIGNPLDTGAPPAENTGKTLEDRAMEVEELLMVKTFTSKIS